MDKKELLLTDEEIREIPPEGFAHDRDKLVAEAQLAKASAYYEAEIKEIFEEIEQRGDLHYSFPLRSISKDKWLVLKSRYLQ